MKDAPHLNPLTYGSMVISVAFPLCRCLTVTEKRPTINIGRVQARHYLNEHTDTARRCYVSSESDNITRMAQLDLRSTFVESIDNTAELIIISVY